MADKAPLQVETLPQIASRLGLHRSTLVRMEQRGVIDKAPWCGPPVNGRAYSPDLAARVEAQVKAYFREKADRLARGVIAGPVEVKR